MRCRASEISFFGGLFDVANFKTPPQPLAAGAGPCKSWLGELLNAVQVRTTPGYNIFWHTSPSVYVNSDTIDKSHVLSRLARTCNHVAVLNKYLC